MKRIFTAAIAVAAIALEGTTPAWSTTFPALTPIYFASGAMDNNDTTSSGVATVVSCSNMSGQTASIRYQFRGENGTPVAGGTLLVANLATKTVLTEGGVNFVSSTQLPTGIFYSGSIQVLSTQSAVFCSAMLVHAGGQSTGPAGAALHMVRLNPHPGTVE